MPINYPKVVPSDVNGFAQAWDLNGIKMILDSTSRQFAVDFANVVLRSYVDNLVAQAQAGKKLKETTGTPDTPATPAPAAPAPKAKSKIILTD